MQAIPNLSGFQVMLASRAFALDVVGASLVLSSSYERSGLIYGVLQPLKKIAKKPGC
jgi:hypothetical protein